MSRRSPGFVLFDGFVTLLQCLGCLISRHGFVGVLQRFDWWAFAGLGRAFMATVLCYGFSRGLRFGPRPKLYCLEA